MGADNWEPGVVGGIVEGIVGGIVEGIVGAGLGGGRVDMRVGDR